MDETLVLQAKALYLLAIENHFSAIKTSGNFDELNLKDYEALSKIVYASINDFAKLATKIDKHIKAEQKNVYKRKEIMHAGVN